MTEKEKALAGLLYNPNYNEDIIKEITACKKLCMEYNQIPFEDTQAKKAMLKKIIGKIDGEINITSPFWCDYGSNIEIGERFYSNHNLVILDGGRVKIGHDVFIAPNCCITTASHPLDIKRRNEGLETAKPITIGNNVWIGANVTILPNVTIGNGCVIGAGSVVTRDIPDNMVAYGNPCRPIREIEQE